MNSKKEGSAGERTGSPLKYGHYQEILKRM